MGEILTMSRKELDRLKIIEQIEQRKLTVEEASEVLSVSQRQIYRILSRYKKEKEEGLIHKLRGKESNRGYGQDKKKEVIKIYRDEYDDYGPTLFGQKLLEHHSIKIDHETLRRWMRSEAITTSLRKKRPHRKKRTRRSAIGEMIQFDGSIHDWFEGRGPECCLLCAVDDASGRVFMRFSPSENSYDVLRTLELYCRRFGIPRAIYTDHGSCYYAEDSLTDVARAMGVLGVKMIYANSPQAKGRVERGNRTHQDRLVKALRREGISTISEANRFLDEVYLNDHNERFAVTDGLADIHRSSEGYDLKNIFCFQTNRRLRNDYTINLSGGYVQLLIGEVPLPLPKSWITVRRWLDDSLHIFYKDEELSFKVLNSKPKKKVNKAKIKPKGDHPWRQWNIGKGKYMHLAAK